MKPAVNTVTNDALQRIREQAGQRFEQLGWPTTHLEEWQYTKLQPLQSRFEAGGFRVASPADRLESRSHTRDAIPMRIARPGSSCQAV
jgi:hypothetical protein